MFVYCIGKNGLDRSRKTAYICIAVGDPVINRGGLGSH